MKDWNVTLPLTASLCVKVTTGNEATEEDAISSALKMSFGLSVKVDEDSGAFLGEWAESHRIVAEGNYYHGVLNEAFAELDCEDEEEVEEGGQP